MMAQARELNHQGRPQARPRWTAKATGGVDRQNGPPSPCTRPSIGPTTVMLAATPPIGSRILWLGRVPEHCAVMACGTRHDEQMPDEVTVAQARIGREESHARRVSHAARDQPE